MKSNNKLTALQVQVLDELGIDLWTSRSSLAEDLPASECIQTRTADPIAKAPEAKPIEKDKLAPVEVAAKGVKFDLLCMRNSKMLVIAQTNGDADEGLLGSLIRVSDTVSESENFFFKWPQMETNSGIDAARKAFLAFTAVQAGNLEIPVLVIFGREVTSLLQANLPEPGEGATNALTSFDWNGFSCIAVPDVESLRSHWQVKRDLCFRLTDLHPEIFRLPATSSPSQPA